MKKIIKNARLLDGSINDIEINGSSISSISSQIEGDVLFDANKNYWELINFSTKFTH